MSAIRITPVFDEVEYGIAVESIPFRLQVEKAARTVMVDVLTGMGLPRLTRLFTSFKGPDVGSLVFVGPPVRDGQTGGNSGGSVTPVRISAFGRCFNLPLLVGHDEIRKSEIQGHPRIIDRSHIVDTFDLNTVRVIDESHHSLFRIVPKNILPRLISIPNIIRHEVMESVEIGMASDGSINVPRKFRIKEIFALCHGIIDLRPAQIGCLRLRDGGCGRHNQEDQCYGR